MSGAKTGYGAKLAYGDGASPEAFTEIAEVTSLSGPGLSLDTVEVTHMQSLNATKEFIAGLIDGGEITIEGNYLPADATQDYTTGLPAILKARALKNWKMTYPDGEVLAFAGLLTAFEPSMPNEDKMTFSATIKVSGFPTLTE